MTTRTRKRGGALRRDVREQPLEYLREGSSLEDQLMVYREALGLKDHELAAIASTSPSTIRRWRSHGSSDHSAGLDNLRVICARLLTSEAVDPRMAADWLRARNRRLGLRRPLELFADDEIETLQRVAEAADALAGGWLDVKKDPERHEAGQVLGPAEVVSAGDRDNIA